MRSIPFTVKTAFSAIAGLVIFVIVVVFALTYVLLTAVVTFARWCREVRRPAVVRSRARVVATTASPR